MRFVAAVRGVTHVHVSVSMYIELTLVTSAPRNLYLLQSELYDNRNEFSRFPIFSVLLPVTSFIVYLYIMSHVNMNLCLVKEQATYVFMRLP